ncbi:MAG: ATP-dependent Clp protease proteolytic subunit [Anaerolineales bacterium]|nr:ATP-dependent Clp protease proteolytic subunit [Anaerolineales bacterium]
MDFTLLLMLFLIVSSLQPVIRQKILEANRTKMLRSLEEKRGSRVIALIHRQERLSFLGFPLARYIDINDSEELLRAIKLTDPKIPIDLVLHTPGGLVLAAEQIATALCRHKAKVTVFIPHYAMSGGTLIALAADEITMDDNAVLGPVDPQLGQHPAVSILSVLEQKSIDKVDDETLIQADMARKALRQVKDTVKRIVAERMSPDAAENLADIMTSGRWTHDYPISVEEARQLGLPINTDIPTEVYQLMNLFPQAGGGRPSVEYIPVPYREKKSGPLGNDMPR